jgi:hypothetical protein
MKRIAALVLTIAVVIPATALGAGSSTCQAYNAQTCNQGTTAPATEATNSGSLPFTGLDVVLLVIGGGTLVGTGLVVRVLARRME